MPMGASTMNGNTESALRSLGAGENLEENARKQPELTEPGRTEMEITSIHAGDIPAPGSVAEDAKTIPSPTSMDQTVCLDVLQDGKAAQTGAIQSIPLTDTAHLDKSTTIQSIDDC